MRKTLPTISTAELSPAAVVTSSSVKKMTSRTLRKGSNRRPEFRRRLANYTEEETTDEDNDRHNGSSDLPEDDVENEAMNWGLRMIRADRVPIGVCNVSVCFIDSGLTIEHPAFRKMREDITGDDMVRFYGPVYPWNNDVNGHGTHVTGIFTLLSLYGFDMTPFRIHIVRALDDEGTGYESDLRTAMEQCVMAGADIINVSLGGPYMSWRSNSLYQHITDDLGIMIISAAGNDATVAPSFPAAHPRVISTAAIKRDGTRWIGSNMGGQIELSAPGSRIVSASASLVNNPIAIEDSGNADDPIEVTGMYIAGDASSATRVTAAFRNCMNIEREEQCANVEHGICLMMRHVNSDLKNLIGLCVKEKGIGAILFPSTTSGFDTMDWTIPAAAKEEDEIDIPVMYVTKDIASELLRRHRTREVTMISNGGKSFGYESWAGTSVAAPHVTLSAALLLSNFKDGCTNEQIRYALAVAAQNPTIVPEPTNGTDVDPDASTSPWDDDPLYCDGLYGHGIVDVKASYDWLIDNPCPTWTVQTKSQGGCSTTALPIV